MPAQPLLQAPPEKLRRLAELRARLLEQEAERRRREGPRWATPGELAAAVDPSTVQTPALDLIDEAVTWAYSTPGARLIISMSPQEGKGLALDTPVPTPAGWTATSTCFSPTAAR